MSDVLSFIHEHSELITVKKQITDLFEKYQDLLRYLDSLKKTNDYLEGRIDDLEGYLEGRIDDLEGYHDQEDCNSRIDTLENDFRDLDTSVRDLEGKL